MSLRGLRLGEVFVARGLLTSAELAPALEAARTQGARLGDVLVASGRLRPRELGENLAAHLGVPFHDLLAHPVDPSLIEAGDIDLYVRYQFLPCLRWRGRLIIAVADPTPESVHRVIDRYGDQVRLLITSRFDIRATLQRLLGPEMTQTALSQLARQSPRFSARQVVTLDQALWILTALLSLGLALHIEPQGTLLVLNIGISLFYLLDFSLRSLLVLAGGLRLPRARRSDAVFPPHAELPVYSVLVPMFREPRVLPVLVAAIQRLDYPQAKLDIKLVLEEGDGETIAAARGLKLPGHFEIIVVPASQPRTKPKACNYALHFARGEFLTIFDAEDQPEPDQLRKAVAEFRRSGGEIACLQASLNYYNPGENWLTRMFTLEYSMWFDLMLPGLERLGIPIPLGGTSNHFRTAVLRKLGAWDPYNVTEDADLGIRLRQHGYECRILRSTTFEEANTRIPNWIRQRSRWIKGYMQTWLVHMRNPFRLYRSVGGVGFWGFQFLIGGAILVPLVNPWLWALLAAWASGWLPNLDELFPRPVFYLGLFNLVVGNTAMVAFYLAGSLRRRYYRLAPFSPTVVFYWVLISVAAYKALWQLVTKPFYWEKTEHGLSRQLPRQICDLNRAAAAAGGSDPTAMTDAKEAV